jgi:hypothetical protein
LANFFDRLHCIVRKIDFSDSFTGLLTHAHPIDGGDALPEQIELLPLVLLALDGAVMRE